MGVLADEMKLLRKQIGSPDDASDAEVIRKVRLRLTALDMQMVRTDKALDRLRWLVEGQIK